MGRGDSSERRGPGWRPDYSDNPVSAFPISDQREKRDLSQEMWSWRNTEVSKSEP